MIYFDAMTTTRERTPEGFLKARAVISRSGPFEYKPDELPEQLFSMGTLGPDDKVTVMRTRDTLEHPSTLETIRRAPITMAHPDDNVNAGTWRSLTVGHVIGDPVVTNDGLIVADILVADEEAAKAVEQGKDQLSVGYEHDIIRDDDDNLISQGPLRINHIAIVPEGRAGTHVRIQDEKPDKQDEKVEEEDEMTEDQVNKVQTALKDAVAAALTDAKNNGTKESDMAGAIAKAMEPVMAKVNDLASEQKKANDAAEEAAAKAKAEDAANKLVEKVRNEERSRYNILEDAKPFLKDIDAAKLESMDSKTILTTALKDMVPDAGNRSEEYLAGMLAGVAKTKDPNTMGETPPYTVSRNMPIGVMGRDTAPTGSDDPRAKYVNDLKDMFAKQLGSMNNT